MPVEVDAAVAPPLPAGLGHVGHVEFEMELEVAESLLGHDVAAADGEDPVVHRPVGGRLAVPLDPAVEVLAVEQDDRAFGRLGAERGVGRLLLGGREGRGEAAVESERQGLRRSSFIEMSLLERVGLAGRCRRSNGPRSSPCETTSLTSRRCRGEYHRGCHRPAGRGIDDARDR